MKVTADATQIGAQIRGRTGGYARVATESRGAIEKVDVTTVARVIVRE
jgi:hypothetical protein